MRALVVGFGSIGRRHIGNLRALGVEEILVFQPGSLPADAPCDLRFVASLAEGIETRPDLAVVASPSARHMEALEPLLTAGVACYVEKPPVTTTEDLSRLRSLLGGIARPPVTFAGFNLRFLPSLRRLQAMLQEGAIGNPVRASLQAGQWLPDWRPGRDYRVTYSASTRAGGGVILDLVHEFDMARWLFGDFEDVYALFGKLSRLELDAEDSACILLGKRSGGPIVSIGLDYVSRRRTRRYEVIGDEATLTWDLDARRLWLTGPRGDTLLDAEPANFDVAETYVAATREFVAAVKGGASTSLDLLDGLASVELALRARHT
jgi:predicted dehydrogenase